MGIYIKWMQIPGSCNLCPFEFSGDCLLDHDIICTLELAEHLAELAPTIIPADWEGEA